MLTQEEYRRLIDEDPEKFQSENRYDPYAILSVDDVRALPASQIPQTWLPLLEGGPDIDPEVLYRVWESGFAEGPSQTVAWMKDNLTYAHFFHPTPTTLGITYSLGMTERFANLTFGLPPLNEDEMESLPDFGCISHFYARVHGNLRTTEDSDLLLPPLETFAERLEMFDIDPLDDIYYRGEDGAIPPMRWPKAERTYWYFTSNFDGYVEPRPEGPRYWEYYDKDRELMQVTPHNLRGAANALDSLLRVRIFTSD